MLALFGARTWTACSPPTTRPRPLADGWRDRVPLHQLHPLLVHVVLFGAAYRGALVDAACASLG